MKLLAPSSASLNNLSELSVPNKLDRLLHTLLDDYVVESHAQNLIDELPRGVVELEGFTTFVEKWFEDENRHAGLILGMIRSSLGDRAAELVVAHAKHIKDQSADRVIYGGALDDPLKFLVAFLYDEVFTRESYRLDAVKYNENNRPEEARIIALIAKDEGQHASAVADLLVRNFAVNDPKSLACFSEKIFGIVNEAIAEDRRKKEAILNGDDGTVYSGVFIGDHDGYDDQLFDKVKSQVKKILETTISRWLNETEFP